MTPIFRTLPALAIAALLLVAPARAQISVSVPEVDCAASEAISVPVTVGELSGQGAYAYYFKLQYDHSKISITGVDRDNTLSASYSVVANPKETEIVVSAASASPLSGQGTLIKLNVVCTAEGTTPLTFSQFTFNEGDPAAATINGSIIVSEGGGVQINMQVNPTDVQFGEVTVGNSTNRTITVSNLASSGAALEGEVSLVAGGASAFSIVSGGGAYSVQSGQSHSIVVSFAPDAEGDHSAQLQVTHNATSQNQPASIALSGVGEAVVAAPSMLIADTSLDLGDVVVFRDASASFTIENTGNAPLTGSIAISGADAADFALDGSNEFSIEGGASLQVSVDFAPLIPGPKSAEVQITHNATNVSSPLVVSLSAVALDNVATEDRSEVPGDFRLAQNFPNPFNPQTNIAFGLPAATQVRVSVYDLTGRERSILVDSVMPAGWHTLNFDASTLPSGTYLYHLQAGSQTITRKMTVLK